MIESIALQMAMRIKAAAPEHPTSINVLKYSLSLILNAVFIIAATLTISLFTGRTKEIAIILVSYAILRQVSGGIHLKSGMQCVLCTTGAFTVMSLIHFSPISLQGANAISLILVLIFSPSNIEKQSRIKKEHYPKLKVISFLLVAANLVIASPVIAISFLAQSLTLIHRKGGE
ncbi:accessory regulator AgrB [Paenibacillus anaericanus]|uniref:Accessory regulator AgrB n=1 Tax=Paenibacillus anaericanus TaxID=170367 RepID=A0A3S1DTK3_9BACL|nr:accessory gene regulator B family protein [Paenibacillus anaericanus]RUT48790.1 accessory regulator AgrB [Paenibacillus anaericanus]